MENESFVDRLIRMWRGQIAEAHQVVEMLEEGPIGIRSVEPWALIDLVESSLEQQRQITSLTHAIQTLERAGDAAGEK